MPTNSGQFSQALVANAAGTLVDTSPYLQGSLDPKRSSADTDLTTFASGGGPVTRTHVRGAGMAEFPLNYFYDPVIAKFWRQVIAARSGFLVSLRMGANNIPGMGDEIFTGTMTCLDFDLVYDTNKPSTLVFNLVPADGGLIVPTFANY